MHWRKYPPSSSPHLLLLLLLTFHPIKPSSPNKPGPPQKQVSTHQQTNPFGLTIHKVLDILSTWTPGRGEDLLVTAYWNYMDPSITEDIRHSCGSQVLLPLLTQPAKDLRLATKWTNISCSFQPDSALIKGESSLPLPLTSIRIIDLQVKSFKEDEEVCTLSLNGYEKHPSIFVAYSSDDNHQQHFPKGYSLVKFPHGLGTMLTSNHLSRSSSKEGGYFVIFDPEEGRGKTFAQITKCIESIVRSHESLKAFEGEVISEACVVECIDDEDGEENEVDYVDPNPYAGKLDDEL